MPCHGSAAPAAGTGVAATSISTQRDCLKTMVSFQIPDEAG